MTPEYAKKKKPAAQAEAGYAYTRYAHTRSVGSAYALRIENDRLRRICARQAGRIRELEGGATNMTRLARLRASTETGRGSEKRARRSRFSDAIFYAALIIGLIVLFAFYGDSTGAPRSLFGFSAMRVLTSSMQDEIPQDSLIVTREVDPQTLAVGDDITYLRDASTTVTHRIVGIYENYASTGARGFETQGIMNASPDRDIVPAQNVVGKVVFHNLFLGRAVAFVRQNALWIGLFAALGIGMFAALRVAVSREDGVSKRREREKNA